MKQLKFLAIAITLLMLGGCAISPIAENMVYTGRVSGKFNTALINEIALAATTRRGPTAVIKSDEISVETFEAALKENLQSRGLYSDSGRFELQAQILKIEQPPGRFNMKVTTHVEYTLVDAASGKVFFKETVVADHTALTSDSLTSIQRRILALEGSGKSNIAQFLEQLSQL